MVTAKVSDELWGNCCLLSEGSVRLNDRWPLKRANALRSTNAQPVQLRQQNKLDETVPKIQQMERPHRRRRRAVLSTEDDDEDYSLASACGGLVVQSTARLPMAIAPQSPSAIRAPFAVASGCALAHLQPATVTAKSANRKIDTTERTVFTLLSPLQRAELNHSLLRSNICECSLPSLRGFELTSNPIRAQAPGSRAPR